MPYSTFMGQVRAGHVTQIEVDNTNGYINGKLDSGTAFHTTGPLAGGLPDADLKVLSDNKVEVKYKTPQASWLTSLLPFLLPVLLIIGIFVWMQRRAQSQMGGIMSIGRSRAKTYSTERPGTTFADVAGYEGVKQDIKEVVDFLKTPERFREIGARIPKGVLLVGPPGTGKTLIARAVAGEAGVPFLSVTGSDFMEMFVGVGASRVRDLFQSARKMGKAIIFVDEIDSIGRKRGAGLGGGHDEREQTLNQMLSEMDGFEATEGIVMIAATNRPDILDPALLRPGRFDRQVVVPLPELERARGHPPGPLEVQAARPRRRPRRRRPGHARACPAPTCPTSSTRPPCSRCGPAHDEISHGATSRWPATACSWASAASRWPWPTARRRPSPTTRPATPSPPPCCPTPTRSTRSRSSRSAWPSASPSSCPSTSATSTARTTSRTASWSAWAAASPRTSCSA